MVPDNYDLWEAHDLKQTRKLEQLPECHRCGLKIQQERAVCIEEFDYWFCDECLEQQRRDVFEG